MVMECPEVRARIAEFLEAPPADAAEHLALCAACRAEVDRARRAFHLAATSVAPPFSDPRGWERLAASVARAARRRRLRGILAGTVLALFAAVLAWLALRAV